MNECILFKFCQAALEEYCVHESIQPLCPKNEVILMNDATYGRMRIGRCITSEEVDALRVVAGDDPRYLGCSANVLHILDRKCSGKAGCEARWSDISSENIKPCYPGLTVYLEVSYECISGKFSSTLHVILRFSHDAALV